MFGPLISASQVEASIETSLKLWIHDYLGQAERDLDRPLKSLPRPRDWVRTSGDPAEIAERAIPRIIIQSPGIADEPEFDGENYSAWWAITVAGIVRGTGRDDTRALAADYAAAVRRCVLHKPGALATAVQWLDEDTGGVLAASRERTTVGFELVFQVLIPDVVGFSDGPGPDGPSPAQPPDDPTDYGEWPEVDSTDVTVQNVPPHEEIEP